MEQALLEHEKQLTEHEKHLQQHDEDIKGVLAMSEKHERQIKAVATAVSGLKEESVKNRKWMIFLGSCVVLILVYIATKNTELAKSIVSAAGAITKAAAII